MKNIILLMLITIVPFASMAQKRSKKDSEKINNIKSDFMIIKGIEIDMSSEGKSEEDAEHSSDVAIDRVMKRHLNPISKMSFTFDMGGYNAEVEELTEASKKFRSMSQAVNKAAEYGWQFISSEVLVDGIVTVHYFYMKR